MGNIPWDVVSGVFGVLGVLVPIIAALYEFGFAGRKRLGYRVQMDTTAPDAVSSAYHGELEKLRKGANGQELSEPSFVLLRIENSGVTAIKPDDYAVPDGDKVGIRIEFPGRTVVWMAVTECSETYLHNEFRSDSGLNVADDVVELPRATLNRSVHYKVLVVLDREATPEGTASPVKFPEPRVIAGIKGGVGRGRIQKTTSRTGLSWPVRTLIGFLVIASLVQLTAGFTRGGAPLDCAQGSLTIVGSTAFKPVLAEAAQTYQRTCPEAHINTDQITGSGTGLEILNNAGTSDPAGSPAMLAFSDGSKDDQLTALLPRPIAFSVFTLAIHQDSDPRKDTRVRDLTQQQIKDIYTGRITNWSQLGGNDLPVRIVSRTGSGTRNIFEQKVLGSGEPADTSADCQQRKPNAPEPAGLIRCVQPDTPSLLNKVAQTPGAIGYSEAGAARSNPSLAEIYINHEEPTRDGADRGSYPFWETEYAYTYGQPKADSLAASFLRYLTNEVGKDIVRSHGHNPCSELRNPLLCQPEPNK